MESKLFAGKASFSNSNNYLTIYDNVKIDDIRGTMIADKLLFDISKQNLILPLLMMVKLMLI